jgi:hypothetical protein
VVVLTMDDDTVLAKHALKAGARAFVLKEMADSDLPAAIRSAARGEQFVSPRVSKRLPPRRRGPPGAGRGPPWVGRGPPWAGRGPPWAGRGPPGAGRGPPGAQRGPPGAQRGPPGAP